MLQIFGMDIEPLKEEKIFEDCLLKIDAFRRDKVVSCRNREDRCRSLAGGLLLQQAAEYLTEIPPEGHEDLVRMVTAGSDWELHELEYGIREGGKPFWKHCPEAFFNLSHSGSYAVCALSDRETGIDIQQVRKVKSGIAMRFYTKREQALLTETGYGTEWESLFFRIWSVKESYVKLLGRGLSYGFTSFEVDFAKNQVLDCIHNKKLADFQEFIVADGYCGAVCS